MPKFHFTLYCRLSGIIYLPRIWHRVLHLHRTIFFFSGGLPLSSHSLLLYRWFFSFGSLAWHLISLSYVEVLFISIFASHEIKYLRRMTYVIGFERWTLFPCFFIFLSTCYHDSTVMLISPNHNTFILHLELWNPFLINFFNSFSLRKRIFDVSYIYCTHIYTNVFKCI